jgi:hypothetical protein
MNAFTIFPAANNSPLSNSSSSENGEVYERMHKSIRAHWRLNPLFVVLRIAERLSAGLAKLHGLGPRYASFARCHTICVCGTVKDGVTGLNSITGVKGNHGCNGSELYSDDANDYKYLGLQDDKALKGQLEKS